jgi:pyrroline-5-carboxylate reductase
MGGALVGGLIRSGWAHSDELAVVEPSPLARAALAEAHPGVTVSETAVGADSAVLAVKPVDAELGCRVIAESGAARMLSIAAGVRISQLVAWVGPGIPVLRAMPNTPAVLGAGASALAGGTSVSDSDFEWAEGVLASLGVVARLDEQLLDAVTGLSGSGPAYVFLLAEALIAAGVNEGIELEVSRRLVVQTLLGSARLLAETGEAPEALRAAVTTKGGTTEAGIRVLVERGFRSMIPEAVAAATIRSSELGGQD